MNEKHETSSATPKTDPKVKRLERRVDRLEAIVKDMANGLGITLPE